MTETITIYEYESVVVKHTIDINVPEGIAIDDFVRQIDEEDGWSSLIDGTTGKNISQECDHIEVWHSPSDDDAFEERMILG